MTHDELLVSAAAYALGALDGAERDAFEAHLGECARCREEVESFEEVAGMLALAAPQVRPPNDARLRERIAREAATVRPIASARGRRMGGAWPAWAAVACLAIATLASVGYRREREERDRLARALATAEAELAHRDSTLAAFLGPEVHVVSLSAPARKPTVRVFWNHTRHVFIVTAEGLPSAPAGRTYQLWAMRKGKVPLSMGTFDTDASGRVAMVVPVSGAITDGGFIDDCAMTIEPEGGSSAPSEGARLVGSWRHVD